MVDCRSDEPVSTFRRNFLLAEHDGDVPPAVAYCRFGADRDIPGVEIGAGDIAASVYSKASI